MYEKLKSFVADEALFTALLVILVGIVSFGLGRQSVLENEQNNVNVQPAGVIFTESSNFKPEITTAEPLDTVRVVASRSGAKYYLLSCSGVSRIKEENKVYFDSVKLAEAAGYLPAANCPGL